MKLMLALLRDALIALEGLMASWVTIFITAQCYILGQWLPKTAAFGGGVHVTGKNS
jgi:hypothetical protein